MINFKSMDLDDLITKRKKQAEIDLINQGQIPHYLAQNRLINQGQIPHYLAQNRLIDQGHIPYYQAQSREIDMGRIPHYLAQNRLLGEQTQELGFGNKFKGEKWNEYKRLQDEYNELAGVNEQQYQSTQNNGSNRTSNARPLPLSEEQGRRINENFARTGFANQIDPSKYGSIMDALNATQGQPTIAPQQQNNPYPFTPAPQQLMGSMEQFNQQPDIQQQEAPQYLGEANQQLQSATQPTMQQQPLDREKRMAEIKAQQQALLGNIGKSGKAAAETPEEKRQGQISVAKEKENIKEAAKDAEKAELASEASQVAEGALNKMLESSKKMTMLQSGGLFGHTPAYEDARQEFDQESAMLQKSVMDSMKGQGQMSRDKMRFIESLKPNSKMNEKVRESTALTLLSAAKRSGERITFNAAATDAGFDPKQTKVLWKLYNDERPEYDSKNKRPIDENLNTFSDYINKDALDAAIHGKPYSPREKVDSTSDIDEEKIAYTAKKYNMSIEDVKKKMGLK
jgi:hypothetical protein